MEVFFKQQKPSIPMTSPPYNTFIHHLLIQVQSVSLVRDYSSYCFYKYFPQVPPQFSRCFCLHDIRPHLIINPGRAWFCFVLLEFSSFLYKCDCMINYLNCQLTFSFLLGLKLNCINCFIFDPPIRERRNKRKIIQLKKNPLFDQFRGLGLAHAFT